MATHYHSGKFPPADLDWNRLVPLIGPAAASLARYDGLQSAMPNASVLLSPLTTREAVLSSKIEGTQVTMGEVLQIEAGDSESGLSQPRLDDVEEVINYRIALRAIADELEYRPLSQSVLKAAHELLMKGVRGQDKSPGNYRLDQNWIGPKGCSVDEANFVPVAPEQLQSGMDAWERYLNDSAQPDALVQLAIVHVEFEALHPFKDGNGRLGRMLIPLFLFQRNLLTHPNFYMSSYLEANREEYQRRLGDVSRHGAWTDWCIFFLEGVRQQAAENEKKARDILDLYKHIHDEVPRLTHSQHSHKAIEFLFKTPIFSASSFYLFSEIPRPSAARILSLLVKHQIVGVLRKGKGRRPGVFVFENLLNIAD